MREALLRRGIPVKAYEEAEYDGITPACAGNTFEFIYKIMAIEDHPRLRGEYAYTEAKGVCGLGSPPLARGIQ